MKSIANMDQKNRLLMKKPMHQSDDFLQRKPRPCLPMIPFKSSRNPSITQQPSNSRLESPIALTCLINSYFILLHLNIFLMGIKESRITYFDGSYYSGEVNSMGKEHGKGQIIYANGDHLKGTFVDGDCTYAVVNKKNGDTYEGQMRDIRYHGQGKLTIKNETWSGLFRNGIFLHGKIQFGDSSTYTGSIENGSKSGFAEYKHADGSRYKGYFKNDKFDGRGELQKKDGTKYNGYFKAGEYDGEGILVQFERGRKFFEYEGSFVGGEFDGFGNVKYDNGNQYEGHFRNGKKNGKGIFKYENGDVYNGVFLDDVKEDTKCTITKSSGTTYVGGISNGLYHGKGRLEKSNGEFYEGEFFNGNKHGKGVLKTSEFLYTGEFQNDLMHGKAKLTYSTQDHKIFEGYFQNGQMHGVCTEKSDNQFLELTYNKGIKEGPYKKRIGDDYEQQGTYSNDERNGRVKIRKGNESAVYNYDNGQRGPQITV